MIFVPLVGMFLLTMAVWTLLFARRIPAIQASPVPIETRADLERLPQPAINASNNLQNLFELPVVFYACILAMVQLGQVGTVDVVCAFGFFVFRVVHSAIHCTYNEILHRFAVYAIASVFLWVLVIRLAIGVLTRVAVG